jgi:uncharacterized membrane protein
VSWRWTAVVIRVIVKRKERKKPSLGLPGCCFGARVMVGGGRSSHLVLSWFHSHGLFVNNRK